MALTGTPLVVLLAVAAVAVPVATFLLWSRLRGPRLLRGLTRLVLLFTGQVATVALVAVLVNNYGQFYTSWSDLLGTGGAPPKVAVYGVGAGHHPGHARIRTADATLGAAAGRMRILGNTTWAPASARFTRGQVLSADITGFGSGITGHAYVYLPPQYFQARYAHHRFPAVEVLGGYPGSALGLVSNMNYPGRALALVRHHRGVPAIYVMLSSTVAPPRDTECTNIPGGPQAQTFLGPELTSAVQHALRVQPGHWGIIGDSTGGYCATKLTMARPDVYAGGVSLSGYYHALNGGTAGNLFGGSTALAHRSDLRWLLKHRPAPPANLYLTISKQETNPAEGYPETMRFLHLVKPPMHVTAAIQPTGGHNFYVWDRELPRAMHWLSKQLTAPTTSRTIHPGHRRADARPTT